MTKKYDVICIGAALIDMVARVERHPLEDDEVFVSDLKILSGGAAANTAYACAKLGIKTGFLGKIGYKDEFGNKIKNDFTTVDLDTSLIKYSKEYGTGSAYVALNKKGDRRIYAHSGAANYLSKDDILAGEINSAKIIFLSSLKNLEPFIAAATFANQNRIPVILNPGMLIIEQGFENIKTLLRKLDILILSKREFASLTSLNASNLHEANINDNKGKLFDLGIKVIIITMGERGAFILTADKFKIIPPHKPSDLVVDTTGAGDAFSAGFIFGLAQNLSYELENLVKNVQIGNFVASNCIQQIGARNGIPTSIDLQKYYSKV
ncbi:MAG: hypothetical protein GF383_12410 [Candidatus Lokiarchaeota archaeon]|nr:hypothetical protein [Candidatus Lokiarchaeota archaeon]MBD3341803.1 hypothetical protein [Candidatus Lokiarchaeota archaeon]